MWCFYIMGKPNNLRELVREIFYMKNGDLKSNLKKDENVNKYMTEGLKTWIIDVIK